MTACIKTIAQGAHCILLAALLTAACAGDPDKARHAEATKEITELKQESLEVHDEIMPMMSTFHQHEIKIDSILVNLGSMKTADPNLDTGRVRAELTALKDRLELATDQMMEWMADYDPDREGDSIEAVKNYYEAELAKVKEMRKLFNDVSRESAEKLQPIK